MNDDRHRQEGTAINAEILLTIFDRWIRLLLALPIRSMLAACGVPYKPALFPLGAGGYSSTDIDASTINVNYLTGGTAGEGFASPISHI